MSIYKYLSEDRISNTLIDNNIRFTQPMFLNDPFEAQLHLLGLSFQEDVEKVFGEALENYSLPEELKGNILNPGQEILKNIINSPLFKNNIKKKTNEVLNRSIGILSLSSEKDNLLMWAHYANSHKGFVVEFDDSHRFFNQKVSDNDSLRSLRKVNYSNQRPSRYLSEYNEYDVLLTKSLEWKYENEYRMILPLTDATKNINDEIYLFKYPKEIVRSLYFGVNMNSKNKKKILNLIKNDEELNHIQLFQAFPSDKYYRVEFKPYSE